MMNNKINVLIVDDHAIYRTGLEVAVLTHPMVAKVTQASSGNEALNIFEVQPYDIVFMDIQMKGIDGIEATKILSKKYTDTKILALSFFNDRVSIINMMKAGAFGYLTKNATVAEIRKAISNAIEGKGYYSIDVENYFRNRPINSLICSPDFRKSNSLSKREIEIINLIVLGNTSREISKQLFISLKTVEAHRAHIFDKLKIKHLIELLFLAIDNNFITPNTAKK